MTPRVAQPQQLASCTIQRPQKSGLWNARPRFCKYDMHRQMAPTAMVAQGIKNPSRWSEGKMGVAPFAMISCPNILRFIFKISKSDWFECLNFFFFFPNWNLSPDGTDKDDDRKTTERTLLLYSRIRPFPHPQSVAWEMARVKRPQHGLWNALCFQKPTQQGELKRCLGPVLQKKQNKRCLGQEELSK